MPPAKPLVVRMLQQRRVAFELLAFDATIRDATLVAKETGMPPESVYKTLVVEMEPPKGKPLLVMMPSNAELDLKALAAALGMKKLRMASHTDAKRHTGLQVGGISALALTGKGFSVYIDGRATDLDQILVSAGQRGFDVRLAVRDLLALTGARPLAAIGA